MRLFVSIKNRALGFFVPKFAVFYERHRLIASTPCAGIAFSAAAAAFFVSGDMMSVTIVLFISWLFACIGIFAISEFNIKTRVTCCIFMILPLFMEECFINEHHKNDATIDQLKVILETQKREADLRANPARLEPDSSKDHGKCAIKDRKFYDIRVGEFNFGTYNFPYTAIEADKIPFLVLSLDNGKLAATFNLYDKFGRILASVENNVVFVPPTGHSYIQVRHDLSHLEVKDEYGSTQLRIHYANDRTIDIDGDFYINGRHLQLNRNSTFINGIHYANSTSCGAKVGLGLGL